LEKWKKRNWKLHLYGKGKDAKMLEAIIKSCGLEQQVYLKGFTNDIKAALTGCHLYFQCTRIDAMPLGVVEAMAMSRPCFVSQVGDMPSWIKDGVEGFVCSKLTEEAIDQKLEQCWTERENWQKMGERAFQQFLGKYPVPYEEKMAAQLESYLENNYPV
jgi:glycosyltransferase involved in cell wall biosynthesis